MEKTIEKLLIVNFRKRPEAFQCLLMERKK